MGGHDEEALIKLYWPSHLDKILLSSDDTSKKQRYILGWHIQELEFCAATLISEDTDTRTFGDNIKVQPVLIGEIVESNRLYVSDQEKSSVYLQLNRSLNLESIYLGKERWNGTNVSSIHVIQFEDEVRDVSGHLTSGTDTNTMLDYMKQSFDVHDQIHNVKMGQKKNSTPSIIFTFLAYLVRCVMAWMEKYEVPEAVLFILRRRGGDVQTSPKLFSYSATLRQLHSRLGQFANLDKNRSVLYNWGLDLLLGLVLYYCVTQNDKVSLASLQLIKDAHKMCTDGMKERVDLLLTSRPAGIKLNAQLGSMLGQMSLAGIQWWTDLLMVVKFLADYMLMLVVVVGCFGISFSLGVLFDLLSVLSSHLVLFYLMSARVYSIELNAIVSLFRLFLGKKRNVLRNRIDSCDYSMEQIVLGTFMFTLLCFLFPTIAAYYMCFATVSVAVTGVHMIVQTIITLLNEFPIWGLIDHFKTGGEVDGIWFRVKKDDYASSVHPHKIIMDMGYNRKSLWSVFDGLKTSLWYIYERYYPPRLLRSIALGERI
ncbi:hypothetical protein AKO1_015009 [Acrasis kona]|uniref:Phosphatidylinositol N-acetylglucosaminyltransferase subunit Q n=1 Tax=Acrasis kona TaxID=1008807 RepID=A0AAW2Z2G7_9EUKA